MNHQSSYLLLMKNYIVKILSSFDFAFIGLGIWHFAESFILFTVPIQKFLWITFCLVIADTITGIIKAKKLKQAIKSFGLRRSFVKISVYFIAIISAHHVAAVFFPLVPIAYTISWAIAGIEFKSMIENV